MANVVGLDIGASKAEFRIRDRAESEEDAVVRRVPTGTWQSLSWEAKAQKIHGWLADVDAGAVEAIGIGAHGCDSNAECEALENRLAARIAGAVRVVNDAELLAYASHRPDAISVISGTGCIAVGRDASAQLLHGGGQGWLVGDDGGATGIVREAVRSAAQRRQRGDPDQVLEKALAVSFGVTEFVEVPLAIMLRRPSDWAQAASDVFAAVSDGSTAGSRVIDGAVEYIGDIVGSVIGQGATGRFVALGGGVFAAQPAYAERVIQRLCSDGTLTAAYVADAPSLGALRLAEATVPSV